MEIANIVNTDLKAANDDKDKERLYGCTRGDTPLHHLNFNCDPVMERNYTPPEVSFWVASTITNKIFLSCAEHCQAHRVKVVTSQAFKFVDPVAHIGTNIQAVTGSALRDAVTSDVEVACEVVGKWNQDKCSLENVEARVVSADDGDYYEHSENGKHIYLVECTGQSLKVCLPR